MPVPAAIPPEAFSCIRRQQADIESPDPRFLVQPHTNLYEARQGDTCWNIFLESSDAPGGIDEDHISPS